MNEEKKLQYITISILLLSVLINTNLSGQDYLSPSALVADIQAGKLYIAQTTARQVVVFDISTGKILKTYSLPDEPSGLALSTEQSRLYVTCASPESMVIEINLKAGNIIGNFPAGHFTTAPVLSSDEKILYVCNRFDNNVLVIDLASRKQIKRIPVKREPVAAALTPNSNAVLLSK